MAIRLHGLALLAAIATTNAFGMPLATQGRANARVVLARDPSPDEQTAARELAQYLGEITGARFTVSTEPCVSERLAKLYVGPTDFARQQGVDGAGLAPEEWVIRTVGEDLILVGGRPRGTLYAVYRFLEEVLGVHWWNPWEESVPRNPALILPPLDLRGKPVIRYRDIYMLYGGDGGRFAARNRLNRDGDARISGEYGGCMDYGPPYHVHTFYMYCPPEQHFAQHPEWFSLINGKRTGDTAQLCLTNPQLRAYMLSRLKGYIEQARRAAAKAGTPAPVVYSVSQNDWGGACQCESCQAIAKAEDSEAGVLFDFLNFLADGIKDEYPDVYIDTLAYMYTQKPPKTIKPRDNIIVRLCDTGSNFTRAITDPENQAFRDYLLSWADIAKNLRIWDYAVSYAMPNGLPMPTVHTYPKDYRFYHEHNVEGVFTEHEYPILADMRDFKIWIMMKMLEDPYRDYETCVQTFMDGFYGPAGKHILAYLRKLEAASEANISYLSMGASAAAMRYLTVVFVQEAQALFDAAERATGGDAVLMRRVRHARLPLDRATVITYPRLMREWVAAGNAAEAMPLDRDVIAARARDTWYAQADFRCTGGAREAEKAAADAEMAKYTTKPALVKLPERFRDLPAGAVFDFTADTTRNWRDIVKVVKDPEAESGITNRLEFPVGDEGGQHTVDKYKLPMPWGLYDVMNKKSFGGSPIRPEDVPGPGYHWYKMGTFTIGPSYYMYFFWSWIIQEDLDSIAIASAPDQKFDIWARIKFEGPSFPHGRAEDKDAICVERIVVVKTP